MAMARPLVPDDLWAAVEPLLPPARPRPKGGRPPVPDRAALTGIVFVLKTGIRWEDLPAEMGCGSGMSRRRRLRDRQAAGVWAARARPTAATEARLWYGLHTGVAWFLALQLLQYGFDKVFKHQFYLPEPNTLYTPLGLLPPDLGDRHLGAHGVVTPEAVPRLQRLMIEAGVLERTEQRIVAEVDRALEALDSADLEPDAVTELRRLARTVAWRDS